MSKKQSYHIGILGAGALGALYADAVSQIPGRHCYFIAQGERARKLEDSSITVNGNPLSIKVLHPETVDAQPLDLIIIALKYHHLPQALELAKPFLTSRTTLISVMNGVDSEEIIEATLELQNIPRCIALGMDAVRGSGEVRYSTPGKLVIGKKGITENEAEEEEELKKVKEIFLGTPIKVETPGDIEAALWWKFMINVGVNQVSAITGATYTFFQDKDSYVHALMNDAMEEVVLVAQKKGINLGHQDILRWYPVLDTLGKTSKTSMLQDLEAGRKSEVEMFAGLLLRFAEELGLSLPVNSFLFRTIKGIEAVQGL